MRYTLILWLFYLNSCQSTKPNFISQPKVILPMSSWESDELGVSVAIFDCQLEKWYVYNSLLLNESYSPASTFKIPNSLIALQTAILHSPEEKWVWDGIVRQNENWNKDQSLKDAFRNSTLWFYQRLAKKIGKKRMSEYLRKFTYGNQQVGDSIDQFWLNHLNRALGFSNGKSGPPGKIMHRCRTMTFEINHCQLNKRFVKTQFSAFRNPFI